MDHIEIDWQSRYFPWSDAAPDNEAVTDAGFYLQTLEDESSRDPDAFILEVKYQLGSGQDLDDEEIVKLRGAGTDIDFYFEREEGSRPGMIRYRLIDIKPDDARRAQRTPRDWEDLTN